MKKLIGKIKKKKEEKKHFCENIKAMPKWMQNLYFSDPNNQSEYFSNLSWLKRVFIYLIFGIILFPILLIVWAIGARMYG